MMFLSRGTTGSLTRRTVLRAVYLTLAMLCSSTFAELTFPTNALPGDVLVDVGSMEAKQQLGYGWSLAETNEGRTYRWMKSVEALLSVEVDTPAAAELWLEASPLYLPYTRQVVAVYVNRKFAGEWICADQSGFAAYRMDIPAQLLKAGQNELILRAAYRRSVGPDSRELSLCVDKLLLRFD